MECTVLKVLVSIFDLRITNIRFAKIFFFDLFSLEGFLSYMI